MDDKKILWEKIILRRVEFLLNEAKAENPIRDQTITTAMRVISNWVTVGKDATSEYIKWNNPILSEEAWKLYEMSDDDYWQKNTINEHPEPLDQLWEYILEEKDQLTIDNILDRFKQSPMVTITKDEDNSINKRGVSTIF